MKVCFFETKGAEFFLFRRRGNPARARRHPLKKVGSNSGLERYYYVASGPKGRGNFFNERLDRI